MCATCAGARCKTVESRDLELELELWGELRGGNNHDTAGLYTGALEMGVTERWMVDGALQLRDQYSEPPTRRAPMTWRLHASKSRSRIR